MNPFINPKKRNFSLPPGCKDLIDVLNLGALAAVTNAWLLALFCAVVARLLKMRISGRNEDGTRPG